MQLRYKGYILEVVTRVCEALQFLDYSSGLK